MSDPGAMPAQPRLSMIALGALVGLASLWVYSAMQSDDHRSTRRRGSATNRTRRNGRASAFDGSMEVEGGRTNLQRSGTIRRQGRRVQLVTPAEAGADAGQASPEISAQGDDTVDDELEALSAHESNASSDDMSKLGIGSDSDTEMGLVNLLCTISEDQARRSSTVHRGITCSSCSESPIRGVRYKCAQCPDYDLCEACEAHDLHQHHVLLKIVVPLPSLMNSHAPLIRKLYPGDIPPKDLPRDLRKSLEEQTHLTRIELIGLYSEFCVLATVVNGEEAITRETFYKCLGQFGSARSVLASRLFVFYDEDKDGKITFPEMARGFSVYTKGTLKEKAPRAFCAYDVDGDGRIGRDDLRVMLEAFADTNRDLTRNMVRNMEDDVLEEPSKLLPGQPISAAFTAPIPADSPSALDKEVAALRAEVLALRESTTRRSAAILPVRTREPSEAGAAGNEAERAGSDTDSSSSASFAATTSATVGTTTYLQHPRQSHIHSVISDSETSAIGWANHTLRESTPQQRSQDPLVDPPLWNDPSEAEDWPVMEALSQDAIRLMVDEIFTEAVTDDPGYMTRDEFLQYLHQSTNLVVYLEVLGSIF